MKEKDVLIKVDGVSKKFCSRLKQSLVYGMQDIGREVLGFSKTKTLRKNEFWAIDNISFEVKRGESIGLIGPNGAGKSTLLKMLNGLIKPDKGTITMKGRIGALIELGTGFNPILTGRENIYINGAVLGLTKKEIDKKYDEIVAFSEIEEFIDTPIQNYSSGMKVRLGFAVAAHLEPDVLLMDEILAVGDTRFKLKCFDHLEKLQKNGVSMIVVSHGLNQLGRVCDRTLVFNKGRKEFDGDLQTGIIKYDQLMALDNLKNSDEINHRDDSTLSITAEVKNEKGIPCNTFLTEENIIIELCISSNKKIENLRIQCIIDSASRGILGSLWSNNSDFQFNISARNNKIKLTLPKNPLLRGSFFLHFKLFGNGKNDLLLEEKRLANILIKSSNTKPGQQILGLFHFENEWENISNSENEKIGNHD